MKVKNGAETGDQETTKVVIDFKISTDVAPGIRAATTLAAATGGRLLGLFVQEQAMVDLSAMPATSAAIDSRGHARTFTRDELLSSFEQHAREARKLLEEYARQAKIDWSFSTDTGSATRGRLKAIDAGDFLVLPASNFYHSTPQLLQELKSCPEQTRGVVVIHSGQFMRTVSKPGAVVAIDDGDASGKDTVQLAVNIARVTGNPLELIAIAPDQESIDKIVVRAQNASMQSHQFRVHRFFPGANESILTTLRQLNPGYVVADSEGEPLSDPSMASELIRAARAPVVLLRTRAREPQ